MSLLQQALEGHSRGWQFIPLQGKKPTIQGWSTPDYRSSKEQIERWVGEGLNLGIVTGKASGVVIVDFDGVRPDIRFPITRRVSTRPVGESRLHLYYRYTEPVRNTQRSSALGKHIDVRGDGGYAVFPGSINWEAEGYVYQWENDLELVDFPKELAELLKEKKWEPLPEPVEPTGINEAWFSAALKGELEKLAAAEKGTRNATLNEVALKLGARAHATDRLHDEIVGEITDIALSIGLTESETRSTIRSGWAAGISKPTHPKTFQDRTMRFKSAAPAQYVLVPGAHEDDQGRHIEVSNADFCESVLLEMPEDLLYHRERVSGIVECGRFLPLASRKTMIRTLVDKHAKLRRWRSFGKGKSQRQALEYVNCNADHGLLLTDHAVHHSRELRIMTQHPVFVGPDWKLVDKPGFVDGVWHEPALGEVIEIERDPEIIVDILDELVVDFPFESRASKANFFALMLTPIVRHAFVGNVPMFLACSPVERTGKTKLIEEVLGGVMEGEHVSAIQIPSREEERSKTFLSLAMDGTSLIHLDNLPAKLDSASLASLVTAKSFSGRLLGVSQIVRAENNLTICASGNNIDFSGELAKRTVPIELDTGVQVPELRTGFKYPDLWRHVLSSRSRALGALLGSVLNWRESGGTASQRAFGGFEAWARTVCGILEHAGYPDVLDNREAWVQSKASHEIEDLELLFQRVPKNVKLTASEIEPIVSELYADVASHSTENARAIACAILLSRMEGRVVGGVKITRGRSAKRRWFSFVTQGSPVASNPRPESPK